MGQRVLLVRHGNEPADDRVVSPLPNSLPVDMKLRNDCEAVSPFPQ